MGAKKRISPARHDKASSLRAFSKASGTSRKPTNMVFWPRFMVVGGTCIQLPPPGLILEFWVIGKLTGDTSQEKRESSLCKPTQAA